MTKTNAPFELMEGYLDVLIDACRRHQYSRVEILLSGAFQDAEVIGTVDRRLVWIVDEMVEYYLSRDENGKAKSLLAKLSGLRTTLPACESLENCEIEHVLADQLRAHEPKFEALSNWLSSHVWSPMRTSCFASTCGSNN